MKRLDSPQDCVGQRGGANLSEGYVAVFATILIWSTPSLFQYYLNRYYDPWAQNFYRYCVACLAIAPLVIYRIQSGEQRLNWRAAMICFFPCLPNVVHQITQVMALFYMGPGVYAIFTRASVIFTALLTLAHVLYYVAIHKIGVALAQTLQLLCPAGALALSAWIFGERLTHAQIWSAAVLLFVPSSP